MSWACSIEISFWDKNGKGFQATCPAARHPRDGQRPANNLPIHGFLGVWAKKTPAMVVCWRESTAGVPEVGEGQRGWCRRCTGGIRVTTEGGQRLSPEPPAPP